MQLVRSSAPAHTAGLLLLSILLGACRDYTADDAPTGGPQFSTGAQPGLIQVTPEALQSPVRIAKGKPGTFFVSDFLSSAIVEFEAGSGTAQMVTAYAVPGRPLGVAWASGNRLLVGNSTTQTVDVYRTSNGKWLYSLGGPGAVADPSDIAIDTAKELVFVLDGTATTAKVFDLKDGTHLYSISGPGPGDLYLQNPVGIAADVVREEVIISDYGDVDNGGPAALKIFTYEGAHVKTFSGKAGMLGARFSRPQGLAIDASGHILMVEAVSGEVQILDRATGSLLETLGSFGAGPGELWLPLDVIVDENQDVFVTNNRPRRIEVYSLGGSVQ